MTGIRRWRSDPIVSLTWVGSAIVALWLVMSLSYPFGWDQGLFAWVGGTIVDGGLPYRDGWDIKGPLLYYVYAFAQWLFGVHLWSIRIVDAVLLAGAVFPLYRAARALYGAQLARFAVVFFLLWYASHSYWHTAQPDGWAGLLILAAVSPLLTAPAPTMSTMVRAGVCLGLAVLLKPLWIVFVALPLVHLAISRQMRRAGLILALFGGCVIPLAVVIGWLTLNGGLQDYLDIHLKYSALYAGLAPGNKLRSLGEYFLSGRVTAVSLPVAAYGAIVLWKEHRPAAILLVGWTATTVLLVILQGRFYAYHWLPLLPAVTLLVAGALRDLFARARTVATTIAIVLVIGCAAPIGLEVARFVEWRAGVMDRARYYDDYGEPGAEMRAVDWLRSSGRPGKIFAFGWLCSVAWLSERESVSRFGYSLPLMMGEGSDIRSRYRAELMAALLADPPAYVVVGALSERILGTRLTIEDFPELAAFVRVRYREVARFQTITIHEINP